MFQRTFYFGMNKALDDIMVTPDTLYSFDQGYGFLTEENCLKNELLQIPELNNGFEVWYWYNGHHLTSIDQDQTGCFINQKEKLPLSFKANVPSSGNYRITLTITAQEKSLENLMIFTGRRHLALRDKHILAGETFMFETIVNVCDFIPRQKVVPYTDHSVCITVLGDMPKITALTIEEIKLPTLYIAGDSTLTDQTGTYPYIPENCYCGWGQFLSFFLNNKVAISNHAHSGLTSESFRSEGHYSIIEQNIKAGDFFLLQFGHNDQKLNHLTANGGYKDNVTTYIHEIRAKNAIPILITPLCRNSWKGNDGTYNDLLVDYAKVIHQIGKEENVPVIDLHQRSYDFITKIGLEDAKRYFYPGDYTHTNDFGAYKMADFVADGFLEIDVLKAYPLTKASEWIPPKHIEPQKAPIGFENSKPPAAATFQVNFNDIDSCQNKKKIVELTSIGVIPNTKAKYRPKDYITRVEALVMVIKVSNFFPTNVYNDRFKDIVGHEWYAGCVECAWSNGIVDKTLVDDNFYPEKYVTYEEFISFVINGYKSRKTFKEIRGTANIPCSDWAGTYYNTAKELQILNKAIPYNHVLTREESVDILYLFQSIM